MVKPVLCRRITRSVQGFFIGLLLFSHGTSISILGIGSPSGVLGQLNGEFWRAELREAANNVANVASQGDSGHPLGPPLVIEKL
jgi:hypothetical protein